MYTTIQWNFILDEIYLWVDVGRIIRPLLIVYNNKYDPYDIDKKDKNSGKFEQYITITPEHIKKLYTGTMSNEDLRQARVIEYITPEEQSRMLIAKSLDELLENKNNEERRFTHCEIEQSILGLIALTSPYSNSNQMTRLCYHTNQAKLACSWFALNWKNRHDKETFIQYYVESPLVRTMANKYFNPCGIPRPAIINLASGTAL
jgi:DNA-directed RNA polymerase beta subunit